jgi:iron complex outermembrane recepter protein
MRLLLTQIFIVAASIVLAQNIIIKGKVVDEKSESLIGATVSLHKGQSKDIIKANFTDTNGDFVFEVATKDSIRVEVNYLGYINMNKWITSPISPIDLGMITLSPSSVNLKEVSVTAQKTFAIQKIDRIVINPDALISNAGGTSLEILEKAPGILVDMNGNISVRGKNGVMIFIDDKPTYLSSSDLVNYLRSLPASSVETIEIMTNPPAKYDAAGNAGVINIRMKKTILKGFNGGLNTSYGRGKHDRTNNSFNYNYRLNKYNLFSNLSVNQNNSYQDLTISRFYETPQGQRSSSFIQNTLIKPRSGSSNGKIGLDYYANDKTTFGASLSGFYNPSKRDVNNKATVRDAANAISSYVDATNPSDIIFKNGAINLNITRKLKAKGSEISANLDNIVYQSSIEQRLTNTILNAQRQALGTTILTSILPTDINIISGKVDYLRPLKSGRFETGWKSSLVNTSNIADFFDVVNGSNKKNNEFSNDFKYDENINAFYANLSKDFSKVSGQFGLRIENTNINGNQLGNEIVKDSSFSRGYTNVFPTFFIQYRPDSLMRNVFAFNIGRRIDRPNYKDLNPFTYPMDRFTYYGGNPLLVPTFTFVAELSHTFKSFLTTSLSYVRSTDVINETNEQRGNIYYSRPGNFARQVTYGASMNGSFKLTKWWTLQANANLLNNSFESQVYTEFLDDSQWYYTLSPINQFTINKKWSAELASNYQSEILSGQFVIQPIWSVRAGVSTRFWKDKITARFNISDIFYTNQIEGEIRNIADATAGWFSYLDTRVATIAFGYRFTQGQNLKLRQTGGADNEQKRVKV